MSGADVTADAIAAYSRALERYGGRGGGPASPATRRAHIAMLLALLGPEDHVEVTCLADVGGRRWAHLADGGWVPLSVLQSEGLGGVPSAC